MICEAVVVKLLRVEHEEYNLTGVLFLGYNQAS